MGSLRGNRSIGFLRTWPASFYRLPHLGRMVLPAHAEYSWWAKFNVEGVQ